jgi:hypothetical protein
MTLSEIEQGILDRLGGNTNQVDLARRIRSHINIVQREILTKKGIGDKLRLGYTEFSTVASSPFAVLPVAVSVVHGIVDQTNNQPLGPISFAEILEQDPGQVYTGNPRQYAVLNLSSAFHTAFAGAGALTASSSSADDSTGTKITVEGVLSTGAPFKAVTQMAGTGTVTIASGKTWSQITKFYSTAPAQGEISLIETGTGTISAINQGATAARYTRLQLFPMPGSVLSLTALVQFRIMDLVDPFAESIIHEDFHWLLESGALMLEYLKKEKVVLYREEKARYRDGIAELRSYINKQKGPTLGDRTGFSQLGAWFEAGT